ncbi:hypothetical protein [Allosediminivita pacifica]|uniref:Uncharacterized protein n=1 Tax=Allosediminivita pacifica TaxID=1267769 RepID=A0A2T6AJ13_9RHOB|nr:hypothetical protein [Allosediminivita pacifica]PTX43792.1 hypothetical protein C8N44_1243 [Allosediminivita pacifica]GGB21855.1 hypothetical protein GCM10011324_34810 [Allosediminivita pacifica]
MTSLIEIVRRNNSTFYDNRSGKKKSVVARTLLFVTLSLISSWVLGTPSDTVVSAVITVQSILVGFGFSVIFFLVSSERENEDGANGIEDRIRRKRLNTLSDELFFNISYYNVVTFFSVTLSLLFAFNIDGVSSFAGGVVADLDIQGGVKDNLRQYVEWAHHILIAFLFFVLLESVFTFYRIVIRVNFFFDQKRKVKSQRIDPPVDRVVGK